VTPSPRIRDLRDFLRVLESAGELRRVRTPVRADYEITEIVSRVCAARGPAVLFEQVEGYDFPVAANLLGSSRRIELALGRPPGEIGEELVTVAHRLQPPSLRGLWESRNVLARVGRSHPRTVGRAACQEIVEEPDLTRLPILTSWPLDGGPFITWPMVLTKHPVTGGRNLGTYRMQVFDGQTTGMHMQIQKGGGFHHHEAEQRGESLPVCVVLGGDPVLMLASIAPLPEDIDELAFAAYLRGQSLPVARAVSQPHLVPASAEFVLEGFVAAQERRREGPFGDHFGHYSHAADFPVFHLMKITRRRDAILPVSVVGQPPQEDRWIGDALQELMAPLARLIHPEVRDLWAFFEAGFHNLLSISVRERYEKEALKAAFGLLGTGQVSLSKVVVTVGPEIDARSASAVFRAIGQWFDPEQDFTMLPGTALDTLDFTSYRMNLGSKMILDACPRSGAAPRAPVNADRLPDLRRFDDDIVEQRLYADSLLVVRLRDAQAPTASRALLERLLSPEAAAFGADSDFSRLPLLALVSEDVRLDDDTHLLWGIFTRFDAARDVLFSHSKLVGAAPVHRGTLGIDATWKPGYPEPVRSSDETIREVDARWSEYGL